ncbi:TIGR02281 family clan AA aspartic protease [Altererythrobacter salegens]|uniref:TIGR02281 family clan AA aspartic protease n=1 Tax=Croceibacterium salegens TaxID=1737568 RepID=A0A6I4SZ01_9SPHN|nr:retropepsin-like aspartic protease [Croceibacterium salegens]MXO60026.1 TIGR02281 family clan AA aspartic protease [Croceibacterium salegens]
MKTLVAAVIVAGALIGWVGPSFTAPDKAAGGSMIVEKPEQQLDLAAKPDWYGGDMELQRANDGHFYAGVRVETRDLRMLVDTGASVVALTGDDARELGLDWDPGHLEPVARGASGVVMGVPVRLEEVAVGDFVAHNVDAVIIPEGLGISLLGQSFLSHINNVAINGDTLTLSQ